MNSGLLKNSHDRFFREIFGRKEIVFDFVREYLPARVQDWIDLATLEIVKDSYVDKELSQHFSDIVYSVNINKRPSFLYLLFEHKSYVDPFIGFQLLRNMVKIWETFLKQNKRAKKLPIIVPMIIYHGRKKWNCGTGMPALFDVVSGMERYIPDFNSEYYDLSHISDDRIKGEILNRALLHLLKHVQNPDLFASLPRIFQLFNDLSEKRKTTEYLELFLRYLMATIESGKKEAFTKEIAKTLKEGGRIMPSIAEEILREGIEKGIEKGREEGREEGIEKGIEKGRMEEREKLAQKMIAAAMGNGEIRNLTGLSISRIETLRRKPKG